MGGGGSKVSGPRGSRHLGGSRPLSVPVCQRTSLHQVSKVTIHPSPATPEDSRLALAPPFLSAPQIQHSAHPPPPNKCYSSCIFNLLSDAIILYTPCSLILMQLLLFIVGLFYPLILFHSTPPRLSLCPGVRARVLICVLMLCLVQSEQTGRRVNGCKRTRRKRGRSTCGSSSVCDLLDVAIINIWSPIAYPLGLAHY